MRATTVKDLIFSFDKYIVQDKTLLLSYSYRNSSNEIVANFTEKFILPIEIDPQDNTINYILQQLHVIVGISYYKCCLSNTVSLPYELNEAEATFLNHVYNEGLGELLYVNKINRQIKPFVATSSNHSKPKPMHNNGAILGVGGGKDSIVAGELLRRLSIPTLTLDVSTRGNRGQAGAVMDIMGFEQLNVERYLDTSIIEFTKQQNGYNGHVPLSAILGWIGVLLAYSGQNQYVILANEAGTSEENIVWEGKTINHQWAKSLEFEKLMQEFVRKNISPDIIFCSIIRSYGSLAVMELFSKLADKYRLAFTSCNLVLRIDPDQRPNGRWCGNCAKCLSSWLLLSSWLNDESLVQIFGKNLFDNASLEPTLNELIGLSKHKPLDCVGTVDELRAVTRLATKQRPDSILLKNIDPQQIIGPEISDLIRADHPNTMPRELSERVDKLVKSLLVSH